MSSTTAIHSEDVTQEVQVHKHGISELSDVTLTATIDKATHHYLVHKHVLAANSNYFRTLFLGDRNATTVPLSDMLRQHVLLFRRLLCRWYAPADRKIETKPQRALRPGDLVIYQDTLFAVTKVTSPYLLIKEYQLLNSPPIHVKQCQVRHVAATSADIYFESKVRSAEEMLPLALYLDCPTLIQECEQLLVEASGHSAVTNNRTISLIKFVHHLKLPKVASRMLIMATAGMMQVDDLVPLLQLADSLPTVMAAIIIQLSQNHNKKHLRQYITDEPNWLKTLSADCLRAFLEHQILF